ncbi:MAG: arsenate reductase [Woeseiaceae bacterium]
MADNDFAGSAELLMNVTIYHNPGCSKSRKSLELLESRGIAPKIIEYLRDPPNAETLQTLARLLDKPLQDILRKAETEFVDAGNSIPLHDDDLLADWLHKHPRVLQRPIVVNEDSSSAVIGRPPENIFEILGSD